MGNGRSDDHVRYVPMPDRNRDSIAGIDAWENYLAADVYADDNAFDSVLFYAFGKRRPREAGYPQAWIVEARAARLFRKRDPNLGWRLSRQSVEPHRRKKTEHGAGNALGNLCESVFGCRRVVGSDADSACLPQHLPLPDEARKLRSRDAMILYLEGARIPSSL
jgi:hypothetical protein